MTPCGEQIAGLDGSKEVPGSHSEGSGPAGVAESSDSQPGKEKEREVPQPKGFPLPLFILRTALGGSCDEDHFMDGWGSGGSERLRPARWVIKRGFEARSAFSPLPCLAYPIGGSVASSEVHEFSVGLPEFTCQLCHSKLCSFR